MSEHDDSAMPSGMPLAPEFEFPSTDNPDDEEGEQQDSRPNIPVDPFEEQDPWKNFEKQTQSRERGQFTGAVTHPGPGTYDGGGHPRKMMHDVPPEWDGMDPQRNLEPYLKLLEAWLVTTITIPEQRGLIIMNYAKGDLRRLIDNLDIAELTQKESGRKTLEYIKGEYSEYIVDKKPLRIEEAFYDPERCRKKSEGLISYIARRKDRFNKLGKEGWSIPDEVKGYLLYRDAHLPDKCRELIELWTEGSYDWTEMQKHLKKLERPIPGVHNTGDHQKTRLIGYQEDTNLSINGETVPEIYHTGTSVTGADQKD